MSEVTGIAREIEIFFGFSHKFCRRCLEPFFEGGGGRGAGKNICKARHFIAMLSLFYELQRVVGALTLGEP